MASDGSSATPVALLAQPGDACQRLQEAIGEAGGNLVLMADPNNLDVSALRGSGAAVALVVLEPAVEDSIDELTPALEATGVELMFEEADVVVARKSWDLQRWKRHLAAKLQGHHNVMPTGQEEDTSHAEPAVSYARPAVSAAAAVSSAAAFSTADSDPLAGPLDDFADFDLGNDNDESSLDAFGLDSLSDSTDDLLMDDSLSASGDSLLDDLSDLAPDNSLQDSTSSAFSSASAFDDFSFDDSDSADNGGLSDLFAAEDLSLSSSSSLGDLDDLTDLAPDPSAQSGGLDSLSFSAGTESSAFDDFSFDDVGSDAGSGLGEIGELSSLGGSSLDDLGAFSADDSLLDLASDSGLDSLSSAADDLDIFPSALDDSDVLNLDDMLAPADQASSVSSGMGIDESFSGFDSFDSFSSGDDLGVDEDLSSLLQSDTGGMGSGGNFAGGGGGGDGANVAVSVEELMALVSAAKGEDDKDNKDKHSHLDNKQPQIGGPSGEFEKWGLADPDTVAEVIETKRNDPNRSDQAEKMFSGKDLSGVLGSLEARLEDMLNDGPDDLTIAFGGGRGGGSGGGSGVQANKLHGGSGSGGHKGTGVSAGIGAGSSARTGGGSSAPQAQRQKRSDGDLGDPGKGSGPVVVLAGLSGIDGVRRLLGTLPAHFPYPVLIRLKMPTPRYANLAMQMGKATSLTVMLAEEGQSVGDATVYILPDQMGVMASGRQLYFSSGSGLLESLPEPGNAVVVFSGADSEQVPDVLNFVNLGGWAGTQSRDKCFQPEAVNQLVAAGMPSGEPEDIGHLLIQRCGVTSS